VRVPAELRVDRSFWLVKNDGERHFPIRMPRKGIAGEPTFRVSAKGNRLEDGRETESIAEVIDLVVNHGFAVGAVPESDVGQPPSLLNLSGHSIIDYGMAEHGGSSMETYWQALARSAGQPHAGWSTSAKNWVQAKSRGDAYVSCAYNSREGWTRVGIGLIGNNPDGLYQDLLARRAAVERAIGEPLEWDTKEDRSKRQIFVKLPCDPNDRGDWPRQHAWISERLPAFEALLADV